MNEHVTTEKRKRSPNFSPEEKALLLELVDKYKHIIETKRVNSVACKEKQDAWNQIYIEFNNRIPYGLNRTLDTLKYAYMNEKKRARREAAESLVSEPDTFVFRGLKSPKSNHFNVNEQQTLKQENDMLFVVENDSTDGINKCADDHYEVSSERKEETAEKYNEQILFLKVQLLEQQLKAAKAEAEARPKILELQIRNLEIDLLLKGKQMNT